MQRDQIGEEIQEQSKQSETNSLDEEESSLGTSGSETSENPSAGRSLN